MSCGQVALSKAGIKYDKYYASEINPHAISLTQSNFPNTIQLGDVKNIYEASYNVDLLIGGSPCQGFSINGNRLNFQDERSKLLFEFIRLRNMLKPKYWLLENVATMSSDIKKVIDEYMGVNGIHINSNLFSAQNRKRIYWTNIDFKTPTTTSRLNIVSILEENVDDSNYWSEEKIKKTND